MRKKPRTFGVRPRIRMRQLYAWQHGSYAGACVPTASAYAGAYALSGLWHKDAIRIL